MVHQHLENPVGGWAQIKVGADGLNHPGVIPGSPLPGGFLTNLADDILPDEGEYFSFFEGDIPRLVGSHVFFSKEGKFQSCDTPVVGGRNAGKSQQNSDIVLLCICLINYYKNIQNIKNCL